jgi:hypothetical protein
VRALALLTLTVALTAVAAPAQAADGQRWPGRTITYHETPRHLGVRDAAKAWNRSGVRIRFKRVSSSRRADVLVKITRPGCAGIAQLGYAPGRQALMVVADCARYTQTQVAAHEFGHILGLDHENNRCAAMNPVLDGNAPNQCAKPAPGFYRCRIFERHDLRRAVRKYGGTVKAPGPANCPLYDLPPALAGLTATAADPYNIDVRTTLPKAPRPVVDIQYQGTPEGRLQLAHVPGACPADLTTLFAPPTSEQTFYEWGREVRDYLQPVPGEQCVAARVVDQLGRPGPPTAVGVTPPAQEQPPPES